MGRGSQGDAEDEWVEEGEGIEEEIEIEEEGASGSGTLFLVDIDQDVSEWKTFKHFPVATQGVFQSAFAKIQEEGRSELTILLLGKNGVGKSSTVNHIIGERKQKVNPYGVSTVDKPTAISRTQGDFTLTLIDTPGVVIGDRIHEATLNTVAEICSEKLVDVVLYVDRLDMYGVSSLDKEIFEAVTRVLGQDIWNNSLVVLTHGELEPPKGVSYSDMVKMRVEGIQKNIQKTAGLGPSGSSGSSSFLPAVTIENSSKCARNWSSERVLPDATVVLPNLMNQIVEVALNKAPYEYNPRGKSPDSKKKWMIPLVLAGQLLLKKLLFDKAVKQWDKYNGDEWGPKQREYRDEAYISKVKEAKREYIRRQKARKEGKASKA